MNSWPTALQLKPEQNLPKKKKKKNLTKTNFFPEGTSQLSCTY